MKRERVIRKMSNTVTADYQLFLDLKSDIEYLHDMINIHEAELFELRTRIIMLEKFEKKLRNEYK